MSSPISIEILRRLNRDASAWIARRFPKTFAIPIQVIANLLGLTSNHLQKYKPLKVLEAGGVDRPLLSKSSAYEFVGLDIWPLIVLNSMNGF